MSDKLTDQFTQANAAGFGAPEAREFLKTAMKGWRETGVAALHRAAREGLTDIAVALIETGVNIESRTDLSGHPAEEGYSPLHWAAMHGHADTVIALIEKGADKEARDKLGMTPLHYAALGNHEGATTALIEHGANQRALDKQGETPLKAAEKFNADGTTGMLQDAVSKRHSHRTKAKFLAAKKRTPGK